VLEASRTRVYGETSRRSRGAAAWILIALAFFYFAVLLFGPLIGIVWGSLAHGASRLVSEAASREALYALWLTLGLSLGATVVNTLFGVPIALVLVRHRFRGRKILNALIDVPLAVSPVVAGLMLLLLFGRGGWLAPLAGRLGVKVIFALPGMFLATVFVSLPFVVREVMPVLGQIGVEQENAAYTLGASGLLSFWYITLPSIRWGLLYGVALTFARAMGEFGALMVVSGGVSGLTETSTLFIFRSLDDRNYVAAYAMSLVLALISFAMMAVMETFKRRARLDQNLS
jgi:sulfate transport system permease protein